MTADAPRRRRPSEAPRRGNRDAQEAATRKKKAKREYIQLLYRVARVCAAIWRDSCSTGRMPEANTTRAVIQGQTLLIR